MVGRLPAGNAAAVSATSYVQRAVQQYSSTGSDNAPHAAPCTTYYFRRWWRCCACMQRMRSGGLVHQPGAGAVRADGGVQRSCSCCCRTRRNSTLPFCCSAAVSALKLGLAGSGAASSTTIAAGCSGPAVSARLTFGMAAFCLRCRRTRPAEAAATYAAAAVPGSGCCGARRHL